jgi:putative DNA primase/helicase
VLENDIPLPAFDQEDIIIEAEEPSEPEQSPGNLTAKQGPETLGMEPTDEGRISIAMLAESDAANSASEDRPDFDVELMRGDQIPLEKVSWLWPGYLVSGKLNLIAGDPGTGKTTLALAMAAAVTVGGRWPDGTLAPLGDVVIWSGEDDVGGTLKPRLCAAGADLTRIHFVKRTRGDDGMRPFNPASDIPVLRQRMCNGGSTWKMLIIDSIASAITAKAGDSGRTRKELEVLGTLAEQAGCAVVGITHFSKGTKGRNPLERVTGSFAIGAFARLVLATVRQEQQVGGGYVLTRIKSNNGETGGGFNYSIESSGIPEQPDISTSRVVWGEAIAGSAQAIMASADARSAGGVGTALESAKSFLQELLKGGRVASGDLDLEAKGAGHSKATIRRARDALGVENVREGGIGKAGKWYCQLPV